MRIDGHQHFWKVERADYHWLSSAPSSLRRDYLPSDLVPHLAKHKNALRFYKLDI
jgi:L-fuconolactonase